MGQVNVYIHKSVLDSLDMIATVLDTSRSETVEMMLKHVMVEDLMSDIWEDWEAMLEAFTEEAEEEEETEEED